MRQSARDYRLAENEVIFRQENEHAQQFIEDQKLGSASKEIPLYFYCECSNPDCRERIVLKPSQYKKLHSNRSQFVVKTGHAVPDVERIVKEGTSYVVVEKYIAPPKSASKLNPAEA